MTEQYKRYGYSAAGLFIEAFGIALITKSVIGTTPISGVPFVLSLGIPAVSFGFWTFFNNLLFLLIQFLILRRHFSWNEAALQIGAALFFSICLDGAMYILFFYHPLFLLESLLSMFLGSFVMGFGITVEIAAAAASVPGDALVKVIASTWNWPLGTVKIVFDFTLTILALVLSFSFFQSMNGIGIGTILSAMAIGKCVSLCQRFSMIRHLLHTATLPSSRSHP